VLTNFKFGLEKRWSNTERKIVNMKIRQETSRDLVIARFFVLYGLTQSINQSEGRRLQREKCVQVWPRRERSERGGTRTTRGKRPPVTEIDRVSVFRILCLHQVLGMMKLLK